MTKTQRHAAIRERARMAIVDLYHNATPHYPVLDDSDHARFDAWFTDAAGREIDYISEGGAYCDKPTDTTADFVARQHANPATATYARRRYLRNKRLERARCNRLDSRNAQTNALWECITDYGQLYQWGRGGRTLAPDHLVTSHGASFGMNEGALDGLSISDCVSLLAIVESFNRHVQGWCEYVPSLWAEDEAEYRAERAEIEARAMEAARPDMYPTD